MLLPQSRLELTAGEDGIQAETALTMSNGSYTVTSGGGSGVRPSNDASAKGLKAGTALTLTGGTYTLDCSDDAIHANGNVTVSGGSYTISTGDNGLHADEVLAISDGEINILTSYEGLEGATVTVSGGTIHVVSSDDGVNAAGGMDGSGFGGFGHGNIFGGGNSDSFIEISGGTDLTELTLSDYITTYGNRGMGNMGGRPGGGMGGLGMGDRPGGRDELPEDGEVPGNGGVPGGQWGHGGRDDMPTEEGADWGAPSGNGFPNR